MANNVGIADGALIVKTGLDNSEMPGDVRAFKGMLGALQRTVEKTGQGMAKAGEGWMKAAAGQAQAGRRLGDALEAAQQRVAGLNREIERLRRSDIDAGQKREGLRALEAALQAAGARLRELHAAQRQAQASAQASEQGFGRIARAAGSAAAQLARIAGGGALGALKRLAAGAKNAAIQLARLTGRAIQSGLRRLWQYAAGAAKAVLGLGRNARRSGQGMNLSLKNLMRYGLGIRSLFALLNRLRAAVKESFESLAEHDAKVKASLSALKASLNGLKASLGTAFAPVLTAITPALTALINLVTRATNAVGMFFAALTGQGYYTAAQGIAAVGESASGSAKAVKALNRQLASFDQLDILKADSGGAGGGGSSGGADAWATYTRVPIDSAIARFAERLKAMAAAEDWEGLGRTLADGINRAFAKAKARISWDNLGERITTAVDAIAGTFNGLVGGVDWDGIGAAFGEGVNTIVKTLNSLLDRLDMPSLAEGLTRALNRFVSHVEWREIGDLVAKRAETIIASLKAAVTRFEWGNTGLKFAQGLNAFFAHGQLWEDAGRTINGAIRGLLDFSRQFVITFDAAQAARDIRTALGEIEWAQIADDFWATAQEAFSKAGDFLSVLFGADDPNVSRMMRSRGAYATSTEQRIASGLSTLTVRILQAVKAAFDTIPWGEWGDKLHDFLIGIKWADVAAALWDAIVTAARGLGTMIIHALFGKSIEDDSAGETQAAVTAGMRRLVENGEYTAEEIVDAVKTAGGITDAELQALGKKLKTAIAPGSFDAGKYVDPEDIIPANEWAKQVEQLMGRTLGIDPKLTQPSHPFGAVGEAVEGFFKSLFAPSAKAEEANTKALRDNTTTQEEFAAAWDAWAGHPFQKQIEADFSAEWDEWAGHPFAVTAEVDFKPAGAGGGGFVNNLTGYLKKIFAPGTDTEARVALVKQGWETLEKFVGSNKALTALVGLAKYGWTALGAFVGTDNPLATLIRLIKDNFTTLSAFVGADTPVGALVNLLKNGWASVSAWVQERKGDADVSQDVRLSKAWESVSEWVRGFMGSAEVRQLVGLWKAWASVSEWVRGFMGSAEVSQNVGLRKLWTYVSDWVRNYMGTTDVSQSVGLRQVTGWSGWSTVSQWVSTLMGGTEVSQDVGLEQQTGWGGWSTVSQWVSTLMGGTEVSQKVDLTNRGSNWARGIVDFITGGLGAVNLVVNLVAGVVKGFQAIFGGSKAGGGAITAGGRSLSFAGGGRLSHGGAARFFANVPRYASGTRRAHGTVFVAGEAGPEIVGHVNGRTEILNKSQLAQTMYGAVNAGMATALRGLTFRVPAMASGGVLPYDVAAQIARTGQELRDAMDANNEDLIQTIISVAGQIVAALNRQADSRGQAAGGLSAQQVIDAINRRTRMFNAPPVL